VIGASVIGSCIVIPYIIHVMIWLNRNKREQRRQASTNTIHRPIDHNTHPQTFRNTDITPLSITRSTPTPTSPSPSISPLSSSSRNDVLHEFCTYIYDHRQCTVPEPVPVPVPVSAPLGHDRGIHQHDENYRYDFPHTSPMKLSDISHDDTIVEIDIKENNNSSHSQHPTATPTPTRQQHPHPHLSFSSPPLVIRNIYA